MNNGIIKGIFFIEDQSIVIHDVLAPALSNKFSFYINNILMRINSKVYIFRLKFHICVPSTDIDHGNSFSYPDSQPFLFQFSIALSST